MSLLNIPSPEQGASTKILSKYSSYTPASFCGSSQVITVFLIPESSIFLSKAFALELLKSLLRIRPSPSNLQAI